MTYNPEKLVANINDVIADCDDKIIIKQREIDLWNEENEFYAGDTDAMIRERDLLVAFKSALRECLDRSEDTVAKRYSLRGEK